MKKFLFLAAAMLLTTAAIAETMPANDARVTYVGRTLVEGTDVSFDWTATYFRIAFSGKSLTLRSWILLLKVPSVFSSTTKALKVLLLDIILFLVRFFGVRLYLPLHRGM